MAKLPNHIKTIKFDNEFKFKEKGSLFLAKSFFIDEETLAHDKLKEIKKEFYDASHHCYAYMLSSGISKYSDDGEPNGTAGIRIFNAISHYELTDILVVVIRYFGGTKLGVGPLGKAYYHAADGVLSSSEIIEKELFINYRIEYNFEQSNFVHRLLVQNEARITDTHYESTPVIEFLIPEKNLPKLIFDIENSQSFQIKLHAGQQIIYL